MNYIYKVTQRFLLIFCIKKIHDISRCNLLFVIISNFVRKYTLKENTEGKIKLDEDFDNLRKTKL